MRLLVGLGNPGPEHAKQRHNIGFLALDRIAERHGFGPWGKRFQGLFAEGRLNGEKVLALKPQTFMNRSGDSVQQAAHFYKLQLDDVIVLYDELDLVPGKVRVKRGGGAAGHNGIRSIDGAMGGDFWRVRLGIGHPGHKDRVTGYVLQNFAKVDQDWLPPLLDAVADEIGLLVADRPEDFMNRVALLTQRQE
ncbi:aminoacyl-tRNA hydrolase [Roseiterribacter gracilis]|uniref:Peptidyl-tRNA hydrolase n=1 Tax=Roseiterribacter gracilis TaxID=2812848 RepID=A0A8S8XAB7_9PROT|nr:peptidyl-tRNA hydrolase [Rhodospirillales bacterium TMPK1]